MAELYKSITNEIWNNPELSLKEYKATELYCKVLREHGFTVTEKLCGIDTAFCGSFGSGKPGIGILGEFDALSGLSQESGVTEKRPLVHDGSGHGCGHNLLGVGSLAAAFAVKEYLQKSGHGGTVVTGCGRSLMLRFRGILRPRTRYTPAQTTPAYRCCINSRAFRLTPQAAPSLAAVHLTQWSL